MSKKSGKSSGSNHSRPSPAARNAAVALLQSLMRGNQQLTVRINDRPLELNPSHVLACNNPAKAQAELGRWDEAVASFRRAVALRPDFNEARRNLEDAFRRQGEEAD